YKLMSLGSLCCALLGAQNRPESPEIAQAQTRVETLRKQVDAGIAPRLKLEEAEDALDDLQDSAMLKENAADLTEEQAARQKDEAEQRLRRRETELERHQSLVNQGLEGPQVLDLQVQRKDLAQTIFNLSVQRTELVHEIGLMARIEVPSAETP